MLRVAVAPVVLTLLLSACGGDGSDGDEPAPTDAPEPTVASSELPDGVTLTPPGESLAFGETATVAWRPSADLEGVLDLAVTRVTQQSTAVFEGWLQDRAMRESTPYFVEVEVANRGETDLGGQQVPLYLRDTAGTLGTPWAFGGEFPRCQSGPLPEELGPGDEVEMCLVFLAPAGGELDVLAFQPAEDFEAITWTGPVRTPRAARGDRGEGDRR